MLVISRKKKEKPADWAFMEQSEEILSDIPETWRKYPWTEEGMMDIITMEYEELKKTTDMKHRKHELVHLASACLQLWRELSGLNE